MQYLAFLILKRLMEMTRKRVLAVVGLGSLGFLLGSVLGSIIVVNTYLNKDYNDGRYHGYVSQPVIYCPPGRQVQLEEEGYPDFKGELTQVLAPSWIKASASIVRHTKYREYNDMMSRNQRPDVDLIASIHVTKQAPRGGTAKVIFEFGDPTHRCEVAVRTEPIAFTDRVYTLLKLRGMDSALCFGIILAIFFGIPGAMIDD